MRTGSTVGLIPIMAFVASVAHGAAFAQARSLVVSPAPSQPAKEQRVALVIGNDRYDAPLRNPVNDARAIAEELRRANFQVTLLEDATLERMHESIRAFGDQLRSGGVGLFYFAGHGVQMGGRNYLIPVAAQIEREDEVVYRSIDAGQILNKMASAGNRLNLVILDACRSNPFARGFRAFSSGLATMEAPANTLIAFATSPGAVASDGKGSHGLYTEHLLKNVPIEGLRVEDMFKRVRAGVRQDSAGRQLPWENTSLEVEFYFRPLASQVAPEASPFAIELTYWESIKSSREPADFDAYLRKFPAGQFADLALIRLAALRPPAPVAPPAVVAAPIPLAPAPPPAALMPSKPPAPVATAPVAPAPVKPPPAAVQQPLNVFTGSEIASTALALAPSGRHAVTATRDGVLSIWDVGTSKELRKLYGHSGAILAIGISPDNRVIASAGEDMTVRLWNVAEAREARRLSAGGVVTALAFSPNGRHLVSGDRSGAVRMWDIATGSSVRQFSGQAARILTVAFSVNGRYVLCGAADGYVRFWDVGTSAPAANLGPHSSEVVAVRMSMDAATVISASADGAIWSWNAKTGKANSDVSNAKSTAALVALSGDGRNALIARNDGSSVVWDTQAAREIRRFSSPASVVTAVALSPEGRFALVAADGQKIRLWALRE